jgi:hypothetical protein
MNNLYGATVALLILGGLVYFWQKASIHGLSWYSIILSYIFWPVAVVRGLYWGIKDVYAYFKYK